MGGVIRHDDVRAKRWVLPDEGVLEDDERELQYWPQCGDQERHRERSSRFRALVDAELDAVHFIDVHVDHW